MGYKDFLRKSQWNPKTFALFGALDAVSRREFLMSVHDKDKSSNFKELVI